MKLSSVLILATVASTANALAPPANRRAFIAQASASTAAAFTAAAFTAPAFAKDAYSLDTGDVVVPEVKAESNSKGGTIVAAALGGSVLLSLPFFLPNLLRLAGINNAKNPSDMSKNPPKKAPVTAKKGAKAPPAVKKGAKAPPAVKKSMNPFKR